MEFAEVGSRLVFKRNPPALLFVNIATMILTSHFRFCWFVVAGASCWFICCDAWVDP